MKTKNILALGFLSIVALGLCACSDDDKNLSPAPAMPNYFAVDASDNSEEGRLRRDFYDRTGIYLLFNDTLASYKDDFGVDRIETVDFNWSLTTSNIQENRYEYFSDLNEKKSTLSLIEKYFLPYINVEGGSFKPYSLLILKNIEYSSYGSWRSNKFLNCIRCFAVNGGNWIGIEDAEAKNLGKSLLRSLVDEKLSSYSPALDDFYAVSADYYDSSPYESFPDWEYEQDITLVYEIGFLTYYPDSWGDIEWDSFPYQSTDFRLFKDAVFNESETDFREKWADYPKIIQKYELLKQAIEQLGINLNAVE